MDDSSLRAAKMIDIEGLSSALRGWFLGLDLPIHVVRSGAGWLVGGGISLHRLKELTGIELELEDTSSVGSNLNSWVTERLGHVPSGGDVVVQNGMRLLVRKVRRQRVLEALLA